MADQRAEYGRTLTRGKVRVDWDELGEGWHGEYNPDDPEDTELLRFTVYRFDGDDAMLAHAQADQEFADLLALEGLGWQQVDDSSYCTAVPASTPPEVRQQLLERLMNEFHDEVADGHSTKKLGERLSWISPDWAQIDRRATMPDQSAEYVLKPNAVPHTCWDDPQWDGCLTEGCLGCAEAARHPCEYCGYGHVFTTHNPDPHYEGGDPFLADKTENDITAEWHNSPHLYAQIDRSRATMPDQSADYVSHEDADEMGLGELIDLAGRTIRGYHDWTKWLEQYNDPAKSELISLLQRHGVVARVDRSEGHDG